MAIEMKTTTPGWIEMVEIEGVLPSWVQETLFRQVELKDIREEKKPTTNRITRHIILHDGVKYEGNSQYGENITIFTPPKNQEDKTIYMQIQIDRYVDNIHVVRCTIHKYPINALRDAPAIFKTLFEFNLALHWKITQPATQQQKNDSSSTDMQLDSYIRSAIQKYGNLYNTEGRTV